MLSSRSSKTDAVRGGRLRSAHDKARGRRRDALSVEQQLICASFPIDPRGRLGVSARYTPAAYRTV
jgi:hypothetical protein